MISCSSIRETHYFKDSLEPVANYYKVDIRAYSRMSSSRFVSGYYDRRAIQEYFSEIVQPSNARFAEVTPTGTVSTQDRELVLLLSTNSDAIAAGFSNLVKNKTNINSIALLANKDKIEEAAKVKYETGVVDNEIELFKMRVDAGLPKTDGLSDVEIKKRYLQFVKSELARLYPGEVTPDDLDELYKWLLTKKD